MKEIVKNWDKEYRELGGEKFSADWLKDPAMVYRLDVFLTKMWGRIADGTHFLEGDEKRAEIDRIQLQEKESVWANIKLRTDDFSEEATKERLENILRNLRAING
jgi:hypothetical protein